MKNQIGVTEWTDMFREIGLDEAKMQQWHRVFETRHPDAHQTFLEWLGVSPKRIDQIRAAGK